MTKDEARECWARHMEELGGAAKDAIARDIRQGICDSVVIPAMLAFAAKSRAEALEEAAKVVEAERVRRMKCREDAATEGEARDYDSMVIAYTHTAVAIRILMIEDFAGGGR